ncbi:MAG: hypothetical protein AAF802_26650, partial [Planctomycetota bacterium]
LDVKVLMNSARRWLVPWQDTSRVTMTRVQELPRSIIVPLGEASDFEVMVDGSSSWSPGRATLKFLNTSGRVITTSRSSSKDTDRDPRLAFELPPMLEPTLTQFSSGDFFHTILFTPKPRPKVLRTNALIKLPPYLSDKGVGELSEQMTDELSLLPGSRVEVTLEASKALRSAKLDAVPMTVSPPRRANSGPIHVNEEQRWSLHATDRDGLDLAKPVSFKIKTLTDNAPSIAVRTGSIGERLLASETVEFSVRMRDDFAVRRFGITWRDLDSDEQSSPKWRDKSIPLPTDSFSAERREAEFQVRFQPATYAITSGKTGVRFWVEDDRPSGDRVVSRILELDVVSTTEHAVWLEEQLSRWRQIAVELHDAELTLYETNRQLSRIPVESRDPAWQESVARQANSERQNARRLRQLTSDGRRLLTQAGRNPEIDASQVGTIAESIVQLESLANNAMTRTADLLDDAAVASKFPSSLGDEDKEGDFDEIIDVESTLSTSKIAAEINSASPKKNDTQPEPASEPRLSLAGTTLIDQAADVDPDQANSEKAPEQSENADEIQLAVEDHAKVVEQFDLVAKQLSDLMKGLEGSTLVKRLKSASRQQDRVSARLDETIEITFGGNGEGFPLASTTGAMDDISLSVRNIVDDLEAFCERRPIEPFVGVLQDIQASDALVSLRRMRADVGERPGGVITESEYWAARMDKWADDLVPSGDDEEEGQPDSAPKRSLPPEAILEVLRLLEAEVELREQTREAERRRRAVTYQEHMTTSISLSETQDLLRDRLDSVIDDLESKPQGSFHFANEIEVLSAASRAMVDATKTLVARETGKATIAAETEAIELLLQSRKIKPEPSANGASMTAQTEGTSEAAMRLIEDSLNPLARQRLIESQTTYQRNAEDVPKRYREPVREFFDRLEERRRIRESESRQ